MLYLWWLLHPYQMHTFIFHIFLLCSFVLTPSFCTNHLKLLQILCKVNYTQVRWIFSKLVSISVQVVNFSSRASTLLTLHVSLCCIRLNTASRSCRCLVLVMIRCTELLLLHHVSPSLIDVCLVLLCSASSSPPSSCLGGLFMFSAVPVPPPPGVNIEEHIQIRQEEKRQRINRRHRLEEGRGMGLKQERKWFEEAFSFI